MSVRLVVDRVSKRYGPEVAADEISLSIGAGELVAIVGPSGSGKSTLLRLIAGLETPDQGTIVLNGTDITALPAHRRNCALVFQQYALFPHRTVRENVGFGLRMRGANRGTANSRIDALIDRVGLAGQGEKRPHQLSGGQQQRVALARALAIEPDLLLLDEPFGALDLSLRRQLQDELRAIQRQDGRTMLHVTHDQTEALTLADRIVVLHQGRVAQAGTPEEIFERPATRFVAEFMDFRNILPARQAQGSSNGIEIAGRSIEVPGIRSTISRNLVAAIRPEHIALIPAPGDATWNATVLEVTYAGTTHIHRLVLPDGTPLEAHAPSAIPTGAPVSVAIDPRHIVVLEA